MLHVCLLGHKLLCFPCVRQWDRLLVVLYLLRYSGWKITRRICMLYFTSVFPKGSQFSRLGTQHQSPPVPNRMCSAKEEYDRLFLLWSVLKLIGKATRQHWTERLGRERRERWRRLKEHRTSNSNYTRISLTSLCTETAAVREQYAKVGAPKNIYIFKKKQSRDESMVVLRDGWLYDNTFRKYLWPPA